ncbi:MAG: hypothetical protein GX119_06300 [Syntrophomonadaceae bacterium]|jgi:RNA polymerase-binding transcription factor DksA|nr:hypothetical protein [Syntrophomonadaceae bacterium]
MFYGASLQMRKQEIEKMIREKRELLMEAGAELSVFQPHADMAWELYDREKNQEIIELLEIELSRVNEALQKVADGKYGLCDACGGAIEEERLQRQINASLCHKCQEDQNNILH